jgi:predicted signal transduction protein with EAL and GGDEF domain
MLATAGERRGNPVPGERRALLNLAPLIPLDERERMEELRDFGIVDTEADEDYDRLVQLAAVVCGTPMAALTFVGDNRQWYKSRVGVPVPELPRDRGFCSHAILDAGSLFEIPDAAQVPWFNPLLYGPGSKPVRSYMGAPLRTRDGSAIGVLCVMDHVPRKLTDAQRDGLDKLAKAVATQLNLRRQLRIATQTDRLTGLPNWFHFEAQFDSSSPQRGVVAFVRLKTVNQINSAHGFRVADALIKQTADRLRSLSTNGSFVGRIKRGLFIMFFPDIEPEEFSRTVANALAAQLQAPYALDNLTLVCPVNLGFAAFPRDGDSLDEVVNAANAALQTAIERDEPTAFFDKSVDNLASLHYRLEPQLRRALAAGEFVNYYQPKVDLATGRIEGVEALIRWVSPERGLVPPVEFVPALEATGLIGEVGNHIMERAVADWQSWRREGLAAPRIAVNVAAAQLRNDDFVASLRNALDAIGGNASALGIEVTESVLIGNMERAIEVLTQVRNLGIPVAIDDFGTGYSSLAYIVTLPIDEVKIDRAFVKKITADAAYKRIVSTCITLARNLGLKVVAEGVETEAQAEALKALQCDLAQGFFYSPPVPADQLARMLRAGGRLG